MTRLYKDMDGRYYTLKGNTLAKVGLRSEGYRRMYSHPSVTHKACLAIGLVLVANNYKPIK